MVLGLASSAQSAEQSTLSSPLRGAKPSLSATVAARRHLSKAQASVMPLCGEGAHQSSDDERRGG
jgi:hypothetical protein